MFRWAIILGVTTWVICVPSVRGDGLLYTYDGDVVPLDPATGWFGDPCTSPCEESIENGHYVVRWPEVGDYVSYGYWIARPGTPPAPSTLWVEWRFLSNHPLGCCFYTCDAGFTVNYGGMSEHLYLYGDAAVAHSAADFILDFAINEYHTYRFESLDGVHYQISVDGEVFLVAQRNKPSPSDYLTISGDGGCLGDVYLVLLGVLQLRDLHCKVMRIHTI